MKRKLESLNILRYLCLLFVIALGFVTIVATGGGGGGSGVSSGSSSGTGSVALMLSDGPADDCESIWIYVIEVSLIPPEGSDRDPVVIFRSRSPQGVEVDLLAFRDEDFLLTLKRRVPAGRYEKVRLRVAGIVSNGCPCELEMIKLASGKIDLNPREPFEVEPGETLSIRLDIDANKSINLHPAGQSGKCLFRPVVFVDIEAVEFRQRCPFVVKGEVIEVVDRNEDGVIEGFKLDLKRDRGPVDVLLLRDTVIFDENGFPLPSFATRSDISYGDSVWVRGRLDEEGRLSAFEVVIGEVLILKGTAQNSPDTEGVFALFLDENQAFTDETVSVKVFEAESLILFGCDKEASLRDIQRGVRAKVVGKYSRQNDMFRAAVVFLKPEEISGELVAVTDVIDGKDLTILQAGGNEITVFLPITAEVKLRGDGKVPIWLLCEGRQVRVILDPLQALTAQTVIVEEDILEGIVSAINQFDKTLNINGQVVLMRPFATIMDQREEEQSLVDLDHLDIGDEVRIFGLVACPGDTGFYAFVILIVGPQV
jgi:hypothetical protein